MEKNKALFKTISIISIIVYGLTDLLDIVTLLVGMFSKEIVTHAISENSYFLSIISTIFSIVFLTAIIIFVVHSFRSTNTKAIVKGAVIWCILYTIYFLIGVVSTAINGDLEYYSNILLWIPLMIPFLYLFGSYKMMD